MEEFTQSWTKVFIQYPEKDQQKIKCRCMILSKILICVEEAIMSMRIL